MVIFFRLAPPKGKSPVTITRQKTGQVVFCWKFALGKKIFLIIFHGPTGGRVFSIKTETRGYVHNKKG